MNSNELLLPDGYACSNPGNSFVTNWLDKRSGMSVGISCVFSGANAPTGTLVVQTSNSKEQYGGTYGGPANTADAATVPGSSTAVTAVGVNRWMITTPDRWVRVVYTSSADVAGLTVYCVANCPYTSAG